MAFAFRERRGEPNRVGGEVLIADLDALGIALRGRVPPGGVGAVGK
jgi:hypothetical protein